MTVYIALLRGINVGGHNIIKMQELKSLFTNIGLEHVQTYIQSGNVLFQSYESPVQLRQRIEKGIHNVFGFSVTVILRTAAEWDQIIRNCPYPVDSLLEGESVHIAFLAERPPQEQVNHLLSFRSEIDEYYMEATEIYLYLSQSIRNSKLATHLQKLGVPATLRNWKTIIKLQTMAKTFA
jgi:uncharacterized protein (DUF1697 family)